MGNSLNREERPIFRRLSISTMEFGDPSGYHHHHLSQSPAANSHHIDHHQNQQPMPPLLSQPYPPPSSFSYFPNPNPNPNPIHGYDNPLPFPSGSAASDALRPPGAESYPAHLGYDASHSVASQSYAAPSQSYPDYYYQAQQYANSLTYGAVGIGNTTAELEIKKLKVLQGGAPADSVRICSICNVVCNSDKVFAFHLAGEKHKLKALGIPSIGPKPTPTVPAHTKALHLFKKPMATHPTSKPFAKKSSKPKGVITFVQSSYCDVCKIHCSTQEILTNHRKGKKHVKNLEKLQELLKPKPATAPTSNNSIPLANPSASEQTKQNAAPAKKEETLESKKLKILSGGAAADAVRVCVQCNVVCNSQEVYNSHIVGKRHIAMMNKQQEAKPVG